MSKSWCQMSVNSLLMKGRIGRVKENHAQKTIILPYPNLLSFIITNTQLHTESWEPVRTSWNYLRHSTCCQTSCIQPWRSSILILRRFDMMANSACSLWGLLCVLETLKKGYKDIDINPCQRHPVTKTMLMSCWHTQKVPKKLERRHELQQRFRSTFFLSLQPQMLSERV